ncbi:MAG: helix-hairpin-helix domain-containing protein [Bacteroidia bacterium]|nr:helix-hairpin-helix domain-containing protein [Bacteroidia bacterium]
MFSLNLSAQIPEAVRDVVEKYLETIDTDADFTQSQEDLQFYLDKPISINYASIDDLLNFPLLNTQQAIAIINHRNKYGLFLHVNELQVLGFSKELITAIQPFINVNLSANQQFISFVNHLSLGTVQMVNTNKLKTGSEMPDSMLGNGFQHSFRYRYSLPGMYSFGFSAEKDPGEMYWKKGPDFYSFHANIQNIGHLKNMVLGDYLLSFGQGLVVGSGIGMGKSAMVMNIKRNAPNLKPYRGMNEFLFFRGAASTFQFGKFEFTAALAMNKIDTRLAGDTGALVDQFSSMDLDGYHRTTDEIINKGNNTRNMIGTWAQYKGKRGNWGGGYSNFFYSKPITASGEPYRMYNPVGSSLSFVQAFQSHTFGRYHVFSEWAQCLSNNSSAINTGVLTSLGKNTELSFNYRYYQPGFSSPFSTAFGNNSQNENGCYIGMKFHLTSKISLSHYTDIWQNPWLTYRQWAPAKGHDALFQLDIIPKKNAQLYFRLRMQNKPANYSGSEPIKLIDEQQITSFRLHLSSPLGNALQIQMRAEIAKMNNNAGSDFSSLVYLQLAKTWGKFKLSIRHTTFNIPNYYNRIFAFENQLTYDFGTVAFYGTGMGA